MFGLILNEVDRESISMLNQSKSSTTENEPALTAGQVLITIPDLGLVKKVKMS